jgi:myxalamid-type polyketide synthase MxaE and MxaD
LRDICYTATVRRDHHEYRRAVVGSTPAEMAEQLQTAQEDRPALSRGQGEAAAPPQIVFVFPGQGSHWLGMGRQLVDRAPAFRAALERCDRAIRAEAGWSVLEELAADERRARFDEIDVVQPTLFAIEVALAELWRSNPARRRPRPGMGEVAAAHTAGALSSRMRSGDLPAEPLLKRVAGRGAMALVGCPSRTPRQPSSVRGPARGRVSNSPTSTVLSGDPAAMAEVLRTLEPATCSAGWSGRRRLTGPDGCPPPGSPCAGGPGP